MKPQKASPLSPLMTSGEVAALFRVDPKTVSRWAKTGRIPPEQIIHTAGGVRRYRRAYIEGLLAGEPR